MSISSITSAPFLPATAEKNRQSSSPQNAVGQEVNSNAESNQLDRAQNSDRTPKEKKQPKEGQNGLIWWKTVIECHCKGRHDGSNDVVVSSGPADSKNDKSTADSEVAAKAAGVETASEPDTLHSLYNMLGRTAQKTDSPTVDISA